MATPPVPPPPHVDESQDPSTYGGGAIGGFMSIMGPRIRAKQQEAVNQKNFRFNYYWQAAHDPALHIQPDDTDAVKADKTQRRQLAESELAKVSSPEAKGLLQKAIPFVRHLIGHPQDQQESGENLGLPASLAPGGVPSPPSSVAAIPPPPSMQGAPATTPSAPAIPPPPSGADLAYGSQEGAFQRDLAHNKVAAGQQTTIDLAKARAEREQSSTLAKEEIERNFPTLSADEKQELLERRLGYIPGMKLTKTTVPDPDSPTGASVISYDQVTRRVMSSVPGFLPRNYTGSQSLTRDAYGNVSVTTRTPTGPGAVTSPGSPKTPATAAPGSAPAATSSGVPSGRKPAIPPPLDADGHIIGTPSGYTPQAVEGANRLMDGEDINKLPSPSRANSGKLARQYGWEQGKFTPRELTQVKEASTFLEEAASSPALAALDAGPMDRMALSQILANPDKDGFIGRSATSLLSSGMSDDQASFVQLYNQLVGTIAGMSKLVRPGGTTEAQIERLRNELPNPVNTKNSKDARARIQRLLKEIDIAVKKGSFGDAGASAATGGAQKKQAYLKDGKYYDASTHQEIK